MGDPSTVKMSLVSGTSRQEYVFGRTQRCASPSYRGTRATGMSTSARFQPRVNDVPGPGSYLSEHQTARLNAAVLNGEDSQCSTRLAGSVIDSPGPGSYDSQMRMTAREITAHSPRRRPEGREGGMSPHRRRYIEANRAHMSGNSVGFGSRSSRFAGGSNNHPGPSNNNIGTTDKYKAWYKQHGKCTEPGPGRYTHGSDFDNRPRPTGYQPELETQLAGRYRF